jgi:hypothetical protein
MSRELVRFRQSPAVLSRSAGTEVLLATADRDGVDVLSETAALVWRLLDAPRSLAEVVETLSEMYAAPADEIARDTEALVRDLVQRGLVDEISIDDD